MSPEIRAPHRLARGSIPGRRHQGRQARGSRRNPALMAAEQIAAIEEFLIGE
jgi:hypothetical protein